MPNHYIITDQIKKRFNKRWVPEPMTGCWLWMAATTPKGYGKIALAKTIFVYAHRFSWMIHKGVIPNNLHVLHRCDTPSCVNPLHLFLGTEVDNRRDEITKGRFKCNLKHRRGSKHPRAKLTEQDVQDILTNSEGVCATARKYHVSHGAIILIRQRKNWKHVVPL